LDYEDYETSDEEDAEAEGYDTPDTTTPPSPAADKPAEEGKPATENASAQVDGASSDAKDPKALEKAIGRLDLSDTSSAKQP
jgi:hypothetical protein